MTNIVDDNLEEDEVGNFIFLFKWLKSKWLLSLGLGSTSAVRKIHILFKNISFVYKIHTSWFREKVERFTEIRPTISRTFMNVHQELNKVM